MNLQKTCLISFIVSISFTMNLGLFLFDAQSWIDTVVVEPENPTETDEVTLNVYGSLPSGLCYTYAGGNYSVNNSHIYIYLNTFYDLDETCLPVITPYSDEFDMGQLMSGEYTIHITEYLNSLENDYLTDSFSVAEDFDGDGIPDNEDNCPNISNPGQADTYPPDGNNCGDICECEGDFEPDGDVDGTDAIAFKADFFRKDCAELDPCNGDFECDGDVDGIDAVIFKADFMRKDCPSCTFSCY